MHLKFLQILGYKECGSQLNNCRANIKYLSGHCSWFSKPYGPISVGRFMISKIKHVHSVIAENVCKKKKKNRSLWNKWCKLGPNVHPHLKHLFQLEGFVTWDSLEKKETHTKKKKQKTANYCIQQVKNKTVAYTYKIMWKGIAWKRKQKQVCLLDGVIPSSPPSQRETQQDCLGTKKE